MISLGLIIASAVLSAVAVAIAAWRVRWDVQAVATAASSCFRGPSARGSRR